MIKLLNFILFQIGWWSTAIIAGNGHPEWAFGVLLTCVIIHFAFLATKRELPFVLSITLVGYLADSLLQIFGYIHFEPLTHFFGLPHIWLLGLWALFATTLYHSLNWLINSVAVAALLSAVMGPATYYIAGRQFQILSYSEPLILSLSLHALVWGLVMGAVAYFYIKKQSSTSPQGESMELKNLHVLITGGSRGIGLALAQEFAKRKNHLHLVARNLDPKTIEELTSLGALSVELLPTDLSSSAAIDELVEKLQNSNTRIDVLVNNAGLLTGGLLEEQNPDEIEKMLAVNVNAVIRLTHRFLPPMLKRGKGAILNNSSVSGKMFFPCASTYAASKAAVVAFTESLKQELEGTGVKTLLMITPGVKTEMYDDISKLYGGHLDVSFMTSIPSEKWAKKVVEALEAGDPIVWPEGASRFGVMFGHHMPSLFQKVVKSKFKR